MIAASAARGGVRDQERARAMEPRLQQIEMMLNRALQRGESAPEVFDVIDHLLAPLYIRALSGAPGDGKFAEGLVDYLLRSQRQPATGPRPIRLKPLEA